MFRSDKDTVYNPLAATTLAKSVAGAATQNGKSPYEIVLELLREAATGSHGQFSPAQIEAQAPETMAWCRQKGLELIQQINDQSRTQTSRPAFDRPEESVVESLLSDIFGLGPLDAILRLPGVEDIAINGADDIWYKAKGGWVKSEATYRSSSVLELLLNRAIVHTNRQVGPLTPIVDATLRDGHRINIVTAPLASPWPVASIRIHHETMLTMPDLVAHGGEVKASAPPPRSLPDYFAVDQRCGVFSSLAATFLHMAVIAGLNILVVGSTGVGKTTVLGALGQMIPSDRRILVIEDTRELSIRTSRQNGGKAENCVYFVTRPPSIEGLPAITQKDLVLAALRQRPDALTLGEARGAEVFDLLKALWTGHRNGLTSIHADSLEDVSNRIRMMLQEAQFQTEIKEGTIALWIAKAFHLGLMLRKKDGRYVDEIVEFTGAVEGPVPVRTTLFRYDKSARRLLCTGHRLDEGHEDMLREEGYSYNMIIETARERGELR